MKDTVPGIPVEPAIEEYLVKPTFDADGVQASAGIGPDGREWPDPVPVAPPVGYSAPPDLMSMIRTMIQSERARQVLDEQGFDTPDEADDFDIEDDPLDPMTPYERHFLPPEPPQAAAPAPSPVPAKPTGEASGEGAVASPPPGNSEPSAQSST